MKRERGRRPRRKVCSFCVDKVEEIDYKENFTAPHFRQLRKTSAPDDHCN